MWNGNVLACHAGLRHWRALQQPAASRCQHQLLSSDAWILSASGSTLTAATQIRLSSSTAAHETAIEGPLYFYNEGIRKGTYRPDVLQQVTAEKLQNLYMQLQSAYPRPSRRSGLTMVEHVGGKEKKDSWFSGLSNLLGGSSPSGLHTQPQAGAQNSLKGLYMYGGVGCGKTMLMDLFVKASPAEFQVERTHFHDFMLDVHARLRNNSGEADPLSRVADSLLETTRVLALDEFFITDVADAMILHRLFGRLWDQGLVLVATSNRAPDRLYEGGLQRDLFLPFIARLKEACVIHDMQSPVDYRRLARHQRGLYFVTPDRDEALYEAFVLAAEGVGPEPATVQVAMRRELQVPQAAGRACMFDFEELCNRPVGAADFIALAHQYHTVAVADAPVFSAKNRAAAYRFVTLVDVLYENRVRLLLSAEATPFELFEPILTQAEAHRVEQVAAATGREPAVDDQLGFAKDRTISRLTEMQSIEYLIAHAQKHAPELQLALKDFQQGRQFRRQQQQEQQREATG